MPGGLAPVNPKDVIRWRPVSKRRKPRTAKARKEVPPLPNAVREFFRHQGYLGGKLRTDAMTPAERAALARKAAQARWSRKGDKHG
jgi:hypothetical protein